MPSINVKPSGANLADNRDKHTDFFVQDTWTMNDRLTMVLGFRFGRQDAYYLDAELDPGSEEFFPTGTIPGQSSGDVEHLCAASRCDLRHLG